MTDPLHAQAHGAWPELLLERSVLGELPPEQAARLAAAGAADAALAARIAALRRSNDEILAAYPSAMQVPAIRARLAAGSRARVDASRARRTRLALTLALAGCLAAMLGLAALFGRTDRALAPGAGPEWVALKGAGQPALLVHRLRAGRVELLASGDRAGPGDVLQLSYIAAGAPHGALLSLDGRGQVSLHLPEAGGSSSVPLVAGGEVPLGHAYELDDAPGFERFFLLTAAAPFALDEILAAARALAGDPGRAPHAALALPAGLAQVSIMIRKEQP